MSQIVPNVHSLVRVRFSECSKSWLDDLFGLCNGEVTIICVGTAFPNYGQCPQLTHVCQLYNHVGAGDSV
jgi:hypothetical protein